jgi:hypothetical protein
MILGLAFDIQASGTTPNELAVVTYLLWSHSFPVIWFLLEQLNSNNDICLLDDEDNGATH